MLSFEQFIINFYFTLADKFCETERSDESMKKAIAKACANISLCPINPIIISISEGKKFVRFFIEESEKGIKSIPLYDHRESTIVAVRERMSREGIRAVVCRPAQVVIVERTEEKNNGASFYINLFPLEKGKELSTLLSGGVESCSEDNGFYFDREKSNPIWSFVQGRENGSLILALTDDMHKIVLWPVRFTRLIQGPRIIGFNIEFCKSE